MNRPFVGSGLTAAADSGTLESVATVKSLDRRGKVSACPDIIMRFCDSRRSSGYLNVRIHMHGGESHRLDVMRKAGYGPDALVLRCSMQWMLL